MTGEGDQNEPIDILGETTSTIGPDLSIQKPATPGVLSQLDHYLDTHQEVEETPGNLSDMALMNRGQSHIKFLEVYSATILFNNIFVPPEHI